MAFFKTQTTQSTHGVQNILYYLHSSQISTSEHKMFYSMFESVHGKLVNWVVCMEHTDKLQL